jgi:hypothetical protein
VCAAALLALAQTTPLLREIAARLTANALKADVSFLASDALLGRGTPSPGLDIAAEYVAAQFRRAGLEPAGDDGYFQTAQFAQTAPNLEGLELAVAGGGESVQAEAGAMALQEAAAADVKDAETVKGNLGDAAALDGLSPDAVRGKVLVLEMPDGGTPPAGGGRGAGMALMRRIPAVAARLHPALAIVLRTGAQNAAGGGNSRLREASAAAAATPILVVWDAAVRKALSAPGAKVSAHIAAPRITPVKLKNVVGILPGSDPALKDTYVLFTAHYDHLGVRENGGDPDHIFNGANDDASGTASVIEIAETLAGLPERPKRTLVFITLFGEEVGELGSRYYAQHPIFPLAKTVADINLEQLGRTDEVGEGTKLNQFNLTGFDYTDLAAIFQRAGEQTGVRVVKDEQKSDSYFGRSDNAAFANVGVPSTTLSVTYAFADYHRAGDEWPKLDYENMAKVDRTIALAALEMGDSAEAPRWNAANPKTEQYRRARENR